MLSTDDLRRRPSRPPDYAAENQALIALAQGMASSPEGILQKLADTALILCRAHSAGLSLLEDSDQRSNFHWRAIAGQWTPHINGGTPRNFGPCGTVLDQNIAMVCSHPEVDFPYWAPIKPVLEEGLLIPFHVKDEAVGTIWVVSHDSGRRFDAEDLRVMTNLGSFAAAAYQTLLSLNATQRIASIVESSDDAIIGKDLDGVITSWNQGAERIFGYIAEEVIGKPVTILMPLDRQNEESGILERIRRGERIEHFETVRQRKHGSRVDISLTISPIRDASGKIIGASKIARDITERKQSQEQIATLGREAEKKKTQMELDLLRRELAHVGRVAVVGQLTSALTHEIKQPLSSAGLNLEMAQMLLRSDRPRFEELQRVVADIGTDVERAIQVIDRLSALLKQRSLESRAIPTKDFMQDVIAIAHSEAVARHVTLESTLLPDALSMQGDKVHLTQVLLNLIINAMDAVQGMPDERRRIVIEVHREINHMVGISVTDFGNGIASDMFEKIFEPFFTTKSQGMGMGLAISRTIVEAHGGRLWATNNANKGTTFHLLLPEVSTPS